ncbi:MAG: hypothetical protein SFY66_18270 [Oculatellaceae cyanobacterium bins.114]|nr:hypothetical protein [Oculatellaceae cyanobacterium bins.114]
MKPNIRMGFAIATILQIIVPSYLSTYIQQSQMGCEWCTSPGCASHNLLISQMI